MAVTVTRSLRARLDEAAAGNDNPGVRSGLTELWEALGQLREHLWLTDPGSADWLADIVEPWEYFEAAEGEEL